MEKSGCVYCRGELAYIMPDGAELRITSDGDVQVTVPVAAVLKEAERGQLHGDVKLEVGKLFDQCPTCGRRLGCKPKRVQYVFSTEEISKMSWAVLATLSVDHPEVQAHLDGLRRDKQAQRPLQRDTTAYKSLQAADR